MMEIIFASHNQHKTEEIKNQLSATQIVVRSLADVSFFKEIEETGNTLEENAELKAYAVQREFPNAAILADDTGLLVPALGNAPGVYSARYAGINATYKENCDLLLKNLEGIENRNAKFVTVLCFLNGNEKHFLIGEVHGTITNRYMGENGFGYDPIFLPDGNSKTFAEMDLSKKNTLSHRSRAIEKFAALLLQKKYIKK